jgi:hypothetical protein
VTCFRALPLPFFPFQSVICMGIYKEVYYINVQHGSVSLVSVLDDNKPISWKMWSRGQGDQADSDQCIGINTGPTIHGPRDVVSWHHKWHGVLAKSHLCGVVEEAAGMTLAGIMTSTKVLCDQFCLILELTVKPYHSRNICFYCVVLVDGSPPSPDTKA